MWDWVDILVWLSASVALIWLSVAVFVPIIAH
jgi:hypothetical protein